MLRDDVFSHTGAGGSTATDRITRAGYDLSEDGRTADNIGWQSERGAAGIADDVRQIHESLMASPGHRANILDPNLEEISIGIARGDFTTARGTFDGVMVTQNLGTGEAARSGAEPRKMAAMGPQDKTAGAPVDAADMDRADRAMLADAFDFRDRASGPDVADGAPVEITVTAPEGFAVDHRDDFAPLIAEFLDGFDLPASQMSIGFI